MSRRSDKFESSLREPAKLILRHRARTERKIRSNKGWAREALHNHSFLDDLDGVTSPIHFQTNFQDYFRSGKTEHSGQPILCGRSPLASRLPILLLSECSSLTEVGYLRRTVLCRLNVARLPYSLVGAFNVSAVSRGTSSREPLYQ